MVVFQMKVYFALLELKKQYGLDFIGVQDQLDWIEHYPATDLTLGLLNNRLRPEVGRPDLRGCDRGRRRRGDHDADPETAATTASRPVSTTCGTGIRSRGFTGL